jgi:hypothetical protein
MLMRLPCPIRIFIDTLAYKTNVRDVRGQWPLSNPTHPIKVGNAFYRKERNTVCMNLLEINLIVDNGFSMVNLKHCK